MVIFTTWVLEIYSTEYHFLQYRGARLGEILQNGYVKHILLLKFKL